jgi:hypothetical protein
VDNKPVVYVNDLVLSPQKGHSIVMYSTDGFGWGTRGAGAAQLAVSILLDYFQDKVETKMARELVASLHQDFKWSFLVSVKGPTFQINESEIDEFLKSRSITPW